MLSIYVKFVQTRTMVKQYAPDLSMRGIKIIRATCNLSSADDFHFHEIYSSVI